MRSKRFLVMVSEGDEEEEPRQEGNDDDADSRPGKEFKVKVFLTKQPRRAPAKKTSTYLFGFLGRVGIGHEIFHKKQIVCHGLAASSPILGLPRAKHDQ